MIRFSKYIWLYFAISALVIVPGIISLARFGFKQSIDFTGGTLLELTAKQPIDPATIEQVAKDQKLPIVSVQSAGQNRFLLRIKPQDKDTIGQYLTALGKRLRQVVLVERNESVGPVLGKELLQKAVAAALVAIVAILAYVAYAFKNIKFGVSAVIALFHDLLVVLGTFSLFGHFLGVEIDTLFVTAFLTTMSFSVHDTIVVFDRIREFQKRGERGSFADLADKALTETIGRSFANSITIIFMLLALVLLGGETTRWFATALLVGTVSGTYSSPFIATPILILWDRWEKRRQKF